MKQDLLKQIKEKIIEIARAHGELECFLAETFPWMKRSPSDLNGGQTMIVETLLQSLPDGQEDENDQLHALYHRVFAYHSAHPAQPFVKSELSESGRAVVYPIGAEG